MIAAKIRQTSVRLDRFRSTIKKEVPPDVGRTSKIKKKRLLDHDIH
jgi:hypothetical protein